MEWKGEGKKGKKKWEKKTHTRQIVYSFQAKILQNNNNKE